LAAARADPVPCARNLMCIVVRALEAGQRRKRPPDGDEAGEDLDSLGRPLVGICPADRLRSESRQEIG